jgi:hypothetical protein
MYQLWLQLEKYLARDCLCQRHIHKTYADAIARFEYDPSVNGTAETYFMTKVNKYSKCSQTQNWYSLKTMVKRTAESYCLTKANKNSKCSQRQNWYQSQNNGANYK